MAIQSQPSRITQPFAGSGTKNVIPATNSTPSASQAASWASGFPPECSQPISAGGCPVPRDDMNGIFNQLSQDYAFRQDGGIWEWSALADYDAHRLVRGSDGKLYYSTAQSGPGTGAGAKDPTTDVLHAYWNQAPTDDADVVHISGAETILGPKTFTGVIYDVRSSGSGGFRVINPDEDLSAPSTQATGMCYALDVNMNNMAEVYSYINSSLSISEINFYAIAPSSTSSGVAVRAGTEKFFLPVTDNDVYLGYTSHRWQQIYAGTATINTSDARLKTAPSDIPDEVLDAWGEVGFVQFQMLDSVERKGADKARLHSGLVAQRIEEVFNAHGLDARRYGLFCWDSWKAEPERRNESGDIVAPAVSAGEQYSLRYEEALCMEAAFQRRRAERAEARLAALEERLSAIEAKLNS